MQLLWAFDSYKRQKGKFWSKGRLSLFCFSQIHQPHTRDQRPKTKALVISLRAECTMFRNQKIYWSREERETVTDFGRVPEKKGASYRNIVNVGNPCSQLLLWLSWLTCLTVNRSRVSSRVRPPSLSAHFYFCLLLMAKIILLHPLLYAWGTYGATFSATLCLARL